MTQQQQTLMDFIKKNPMLLQLIETLNLKLL